MTPEQREQILQALWPQGAKSKLSVWAVLDCARDPKIYLALLESRLEFRCLYSGTIPRALEMNAPQLVELLPDHRLTLRLLDEGWGKAWGLFLTTDDAARLRDHLRRWLKVRDDAGRRYLFRFYDPRVLPAWLKSATPAQLARFFGPIQRIVTEVSRGRSLWEYRVEQGQLVELQLELPSALGSG